MTSTLSERETETVQLLAEGLTYKQIAYQLGLSTSTIRARLHNIYGKLGVRDRAQAVLAAASGAHDGYAIAEDRELYEAIRDALAEIASLLRHRQRDKLTSRQHGFLDAADRYLRARPSDRDHALTEMTSAFHELLAERGLDLTKDRRAERVHRTGANLNLAVLGSRSRDRARPQKRQASRVRSRTAKPGPRTEAGREALRAGARAAMHRRWHVNRGIRKPGCPHCEAAGLMQDRREGAA